MPYFPSSAYSPRTIENRNGVSFDAGKTKVLFAEDLNSINDEIIAIEEYLTDPQSGGIGSIREVSEEELGGTLNGTNRVFSADFLPIAGTYKLFYNGLRQREGIDYSRSGVDFTFTYDLAADGQKPIIDYKYIVT